MSVAEYEKKYTELSKYATAIVADEIDRCKRFEEGLREEIRNPVTASAEWTNFSKLVETAMRVERSLTGKKTKGESFRSRRAIHSSSAAQSSRRFVPGVSSRGNFKARSSG